MESSECSICQDFTFTDEGLRSLVLSEIYRRNNGEGHRDIPQLQRYSIQRCFLEAGFADAFENTSVESLGNFITPFQCQGIAHSFHQGCFLGYCFQSCLQTEFGRQNFDQISCPQCRNTLRADILAHAFRAHSSGTTNFPFSGRCRTSSPSVSGPNMDVSAAAARNDEDPMTIDTQDSDSSRDEEVARILQDLEDYEQRRDQLGIPSQGPTIEELYNAGGHHEDEDSNFPPSPQCA